MNVTIAFTMDNEKVSRTHSALSPPPPHFSPFPAFAHPDPSLGVIVRCAPNPDPLTRRPDTQPTHFVFSGLPTSS